MGTPPTGFTTLVTTYRGVQIWYNPTDPRYFCEPPGGMSFDYTLQEAKAYIDLILGPAPLPTTYTCPTCRTSFSTEAQLLAHIASVHPVAPPPPAPVDYLAETYRGVEVWFVQAIGMYRALVAAGYPAVGFTLPLIRTFIDGILAFLNPPPSGGDSLLGQIVDTIKAWLAPIFTPLQNAWSDFWTYTWPAWTTSFTELKASWDEFYTHTLANMLENLRGLRDTWDTFWTKTYPAMLAKSKAKEDELTASLEANRIALEAGTIEGDTTTRSWVSTGFLGWLSAAIGKVPPTMFSGVFAFLSSGWAQGAAESFWRGLDEGLEE